MYKKNKARINENSSSVRPEPCFVPAAAREWLQRGNRAALRDFGSWEDLAPLTSQRLPNRRFKGLRAGFFNHYWRRAAASGAGDVPEKPSTGGGSAASVLEDEDLQGVPLTTVPSLFQQSFEPLLLISTISIFSLQISQGRREPATGRAWLVLGTQLTPMGTRPQPCRPLSSSYRAFQSAGEREVSLQTAP